MIRPESAFRNNNSKLRSPFPKLNQSSNQISPFMAEMPKENVQSQISQHRDQVKSENPQLNSHIKIDKYQLAVLLMKFELEKMGFRGKKQLSVAEKYVKRADLQSFQAKNLKQWVQSKKSQVVNLLIERQQPEYVQNLLAIPSRKANNKISSMNNRLKLQPQYEKQYKKQQLQQQNEVKITRVPQPITVIKIESKNKIEQKNIQIEEIVCPICLIQTTQYIKRNCGHIFCNSCTRQYILQNMASGNYIIDCPEQMCYQKMDQAEAKLVLSRAQLERFNKFKQKVTLQNNPNNKFCNRPDCGKLLKQLKDKKLFCQQCNINFCQTCQQPEHPGKSCSEILNQQIDQAYKSFKIKKCPSCSSPIQKIDGCNHMTCKKCKAEFCWICLDKYTPYHYRIYNCCGCPGLQFQQVEERGFKRFLQVLFYIFLPLLLAIAISGVFLVLPFFMVFDFFTKPCKWLSDYDTKCEIQVMNFFCCCFPQCFISLLTYFVLLPRSALACIFVSPIQYFSIIINIICNVV